MGECLTRDGNFGNAASRSHVYGWRAEEAVENARRQLADALGADPREIVWTSGATESNNLAIKGFARANRSRGKHIVTSRIEHKSVLDTCKALGEEGFEIDYLDPDADGRVSCERLQEALREDTILVSLMHLNNEVGAINDIRALARLCRQQNVAFHCDAAQSVGKIACDVRDLDVDLLSVSAHKFYGPKGSGALYVRRAPGVVVEAQMHGGGHERNMRSGTLATHQIVGLGLAVELATAERDDEYLRLQKLRSRFLEAVLELPGVSVNGAIESSFPGIVNVCFEQIDSETLMIHLRDLALSSGSACTSTDVEPSYVLRAMGLTPVQAQSSLRFSFGRYTREDDIDFAVEKIRTSVQTLRGQRLASVSQS